MQRAFGTRNPDGCAKTIWNAKPTKGRENRERKPRHPLFFAVFAAFRGFRVPNALHPQRPCYPQDMHARFVHRPVDGEYSNRHDYLAQRNS